MNVVFSKNLKHFLLSGLVLAFLVSCGGAEDRKEKYLEKARSYMKDNNLEKARIELKNVLQIDPKNAESYYLLAEISYFKKSMSAAVNNYKKSIELNPDYNDAKISLAKTYSVTDYDVYLTDAERLLDEVKKSLGYNEKANVIKATILIKRHKESEAEKILKGVIDKSPKYINAYSTLGYIYLKEKKYEEATKRLNQGLSENPDNIQLLMSLADVYIKQKMQDQAESVIKRVIALNTNTYSYQVALATFYVKNKELNKAEKILRDAVNENYNDATRIATLINFLAQHRSMQAAISELETIVKKVPKNHENKYSLSNYYTITGQYRKALAVLKEIIELDSLSPLAVKSRVKIADIYFKQNNYTKAKATLASVLDENRNVISAQLIKSKIDIINDKLDDAVNSLRLIVKDQPGHKEAPMLLAKALKKQGQIDLAFTTLSQLINAAPGNHQAYIDFSNFLMENNRSDQALDVINSAIDLFRTNFDVFKQKFKILFALKKNDEIIAMLKELKLLMPSRYEVYHLSGVYFIKMEKYSLAIQDLERALSKTEELYPIYRSVMKAYLSNNQKDKLYAFLNKEIQIENRKISALQTLGDLYFTDEQFKKSEKSYKQTLQIQSDWAPAYKALIRVAVANRKYDDAIAYFKQAINIGDGKDNMKIRLIRFYTSLSKYREADALYGELLKETPYNAILINNYISFVLNYMSDASHMSQVKSLIARIENHSNMTIQDTVAWYYTNTKQYKKALAIYQKIEPDINGEAHYQYHYGYTLFMNNEKLKAKSYLEAALKSKEVFKGKDKIKALINQI